MKTVKYSLEDYKRDERKADLEKNKFGYFLYTKEQKKIIEKNKKEKEQDMKKYMKKFVPRSITGKKLK